MGMGCRQAGGWVDGVGDSHSKASYFLSVGSGVMRDAASFSTRVVDNCVGRMGVGRRCSS